MTRESRLVVRPEESADAPAVQEIIAAAFAPTGGVVIEVGLNDELRHDPDRIPELCLVAERDGTVVGQLTSSYGVLTDPAGGPERRLVGVGPVAVHPADQGTGVGRAMLADLIDRARRAGELALVLLGDPAFYGRFGFHPAAEAGIAAPDPKWGVHFQALVIATETEVSGRFVYAAPFGRL
ncbi:MAG TPA: N-acetyltransferase [Nakamurella sp.]